MVSGPHVPLVHLISQWAKWQRHFRAWAYVRKAEFGLTMQTLQWGYASCRGNRQGNNFRRWLRGKRQSHQHERVSWERQNRIHSNSDQRQTVDFPTSEKQVHGKLPMDSMNPVGWEVMVQTLRSNLRKTRPWALTPGAFLPLSQIVSWADSMVSLGSTSQQVVSQSLITSPEATHFDNWVISSRFTQASANRLCGRRVPRRSSQPCWMVCYGYQRKSGLMPHFFPYSCNGSKSSDKMVFLMFLI